MSYAYKFSAYTYPMSTEYFEYFREQWVNLGNDYSNTSGMSYEVLCMAVA